MVASDKSDKILYGTSINRVDVLEMTKYVSLFFT